MSETKAPRARLLVVDDEDYVRQSLAELLRAAGYEVLTADGPPAALALVRRAHLDVVLTDLRMAAGGGLGLLRDLRAATPDLPVLVLTAYGSIGSAVDCLRAGAADYLIKPASPEALETAIERCLETRALRREVGYLRGTSGVPSGADRAAVGDSPAWRAVVDRAVAAAPTDATVLILGESGVGKEVIARIVHERSARAARPFVRLNCAAVPLDVWESEFFGHRRGAFTGAAADREGRFLLAHQGTIFLDEIGATPLPAQAKLLRVLQEGEFERLGEDRPTRVDVRVIAATNSDLRAAMEAGAFRRDLFYRLDVVRLEVPPLRARPADIALLAEHFVGELAARLGRRPPQLGSGVLQDLQAYAWPGNVRELRNVLERSLILDPGEVLTSLDLPPVQGLAPAGAPPDAELNLRVVLAQRERELLLEALRRSRGVRKEAARLLGIDPRNLPYYMRKHGLENEAPD